jgi:hypothetical protein
LGRKRSIDDIKEEYYLMKMLENSTIQIHTYLYPCEDKDRVIIALKNVLEGEVEEEYHGELTRIVVKGRGKEPVRKLFNQFRNRRVLAAVRKHIMKYIDKDRIRIYLHKQSAFAGVYSICDPGDSPLGEIVVDIYVDDPRSITMWITRF